MCDRKYRAVVRLEPAPVDEEVPESLVPGPERFGLTVLQGEVGEHAVEEVVGKPLGADGEVGSLNITTDFPWKILVEEPSVIEGDRPVVEDLSPFRVLEIDGAASE